MVKHLAATMYLKVTKRFPKAKKKELISMDNKGIIIYHEDYKALSDTLNEG